MSKIFCLVSFLFLAIYGLRGIAVYNEYNNQYKSEWDLADRSSTLPEKARHLDNFISRLEKAGLSGVYDGVVYKNAQDSFDNNLAAIKSLQTRLNEMKGMDISSTAYQMGIQQITAQEQGEAHSMIETIKECWYYQYHPMYWGWIVYVIFFPIFALMIISGGMWYEDSAW